MCASICLLIFIFPSDLHAQIEADTSKIQTTQDDQAPQIEKNLSDSSSPVAAKLPNQKTDFMRVIERSDDDLLIFSLNIGRMTILENLLIYEDLDTGLFHVPFKDVVDALDFAIDINPDAGTAKGWFIDETREFDLNLNTGKINVAGNKKSLSPGSVELYPDGIYVTIESLEEWFPANFDVDFGELAIQIKSIEPLPIEIALERDKNRRKTSRSKAFIKDVDSPTVEYEAPLFNIPFVDTSAQVTFDNAEGVDEKLRASSSILAEGIFLGQDTALSINDSSDDGEPVDIRLTMGRTDVDADLLGAGISEYQLGDISTQSVPLIAGNTAGRGAYISTFPLSSNSRSRSNSITLRGELGVGYQVDVMRNGDLLDFIEAPDDNGEYVFEDLTVFPGLNVFELVFYGPQGQKEIREERVFVPINSLEKGKFGFRGAFLEDDTNLFTDRSSVDPDAGEPRGIFEAEYGLTDFTSIFGALGSLSVEGQRQEYVLGGLGTSIGGTRIDFNYARSSESGNAFRTQILDNFKGVRLNFQHAYFDNFISDETISASVPGNLRNMTEIDASGVLPLGFFQIPITVSGERLDDDRGNEIYSWDARVTRNYFGIRSAASVLQRIQTDRDTETDLALQLSSRVSDVTLRGDIRYGVSPDTELEAVSLTSDFSLDEDLNLRLGYSRSGTDDPLNTISAGLNTDLDLANLGFDISYDDNDEVRAILSTSFGLAYDPFAERVHMTSRSLAGTAAVSARTYIDKNYNSIFDEGDVPLEDILFSGRGVDRQKGSDETGYRFLAGLEKDGRNKVELNEVSIEDPFSIDTVGPLDFIVRPAGIIKKDYPVILVGEVDGNILIERNGRRLAGAAFIVELKDLQGNIIKTQESEFDGFLLIQEVPLGDYTAQVKPEQLKELGYCPSEKQSLSLSEEEPFATLQDIILVANSIEEGEQPLGILLAHGVHLKDAQFKWHIMKDVFDESFGENARAQYKRIREDMVIEPIYQLVSGPYQNVDQIHETCQALFEYGLPCGQAIWTACADGEKVVMDSSLKFDIDQYKRQALERHLSTSPQQP